MYVIGIDPSLSSTGICLLDNGNVSDVDNILTRDLRGVPRLKYIARNVIFWLNKGPDIAVIEGPAMGIKGGRVFDIGELHGALKTILYDHKIPTYVVSPSSMKKFVTGKGNAKKDQIKDSLLLTWDIDTDQEDQADAIGLALFGHYLTHKRLQRSLSQAQQEALKKYEILK